MKTADLALFSGDCFERLTPLEAIKDDQSKYSEKAFHVMKAEFRPSTGHLLQRIGRPRKTDRSIRRRRFGEKRISVFGDVCNKRIF